MKHLCKFFPVFLLLLCAGCYQPDTVLISPEYGQVPRDYQFPAVDCSNLQLSVASEKTCFAGEPLRVTLRLKNLGGKQIRIPEWYQNEADNISLSCQIWTPGMKEPDPDGWISLAEPPAKPVRHFNLELNPENQVLFSRDLNFISNLVVSPGSERRYFVKAELNLKSAPMATIFAISVLPARQK